MKTNLIQNVLGTITLLVIVILLTGCPFSGTIPIDEGTVVVPDDILGTWVKVSDTSETNPATYTISRKDKYHAEVSKFEPAENEADSHETFYGLTFSDVKGDVFLNVQEAGSSTFYYYKFHYDKEAMQISLFEVSDYIKESFDSSKDLKDFIIRNKSLSFFFTNTTETYIRKDKQ